MVQARGVAYDFWLLIEKKRAEKELTKAQLHELSGIAVSTTNGLKSGTRPPLPRVVNALADALGIDREEAARLSGLLPRTDLALPADSTVRNAIHNSGAYTQQQKEALLAMVEVLDTANRSGESGSHGQAV